MGADAAESNSTSRGLPGSGAALPGVLAVVVAVLMATLVLVVVAGNALVIMAFVVDKTLRTQSNYFFLNLAISDFLVGTFCIPVYIPYNLTGRWMLGAGLCKVWLVMDYLLCTASVFNVVLISYDRFLSVTRAVRYRAQRNMTRQAVTKMVAVWLLAFLLYGPAILFWEALAGRGSVVPANQCFAEFYFTWYFLLSASTFEFFTPFVSVAFFNLRIYLNIRRRNKGMAAAACACAEESSSAAHAAAAADAVRLQQHGLRTTRGESAAAAAAVWSVFFVKTRKVSSSEPTAISAVIEDDFGASSGGGAAQTFAHRKTLSPCGSGSGGGGAAVLFEARSPGGNNAPGRRTTQGSRLSRDKKIAKSLAVIVCTFGVCWAPYTLLMIIRAACSGTCVQHYWYEMTFWLLWLNSAINPFLYPLCHSSFRRAFSRILCPKGQSVQPQIIEVQSC
ncbi:Histamine H3 receptor [Merluccius polli]|uniref:Histamine H3 receptor n=1 Tax=Merluccius polli TaxID=89951 RepID=A0AA47N2B9_MERPO|nr:Histamine H3 receptor [Merluccius polli]